jgi:hypothetical protein
MMFSFLKTRFKFGGTQFTRQDWDCRIREDQPVSTSFRKTDQPVLTSFRKEDQPVPTECRFRLADQPVLGGFRWTGVDFINPFRP